LDARFDAPLEARFDAPARDDDLDAALRDPPAFRAEEAFRPDDFAADFRLEDERERVEPDADFRLADFRLDALRAVVFRLDALRAVVFRLDALRAVAFRAVPLRAVAFRAPPEDLRAPVDFRVEADFRLPALELRARDEDFRAPPADLDADRADAPFERVLRRAEPLAVERFALLRAPVDRLRVEEPLFLLPPDFERVAMTMLLGRRCACPSMQELGTQRHLRRCAAQIFRPSANNASGAAKFEA
jgi:hypothetical protein